MIRVYLILTTMWRPPRTESYIIIIIVVFSMT